MGATSTTNLQITLTTDGDGNVKASLSGVADAVKQIKPAANEAHSALEQIRGTVETIKGLMEAWGVYEVLKEAIGGFIEANAQAAQFKATLIAVTGSAGEAAAVYAQIGEIANTTSSNTGQIVDAYVRLRNVGITPTSETLESLANIAVGTGTTIDQVANAMASAYEGNTRGLKQLGITAQEAGDKLILSFQGQKTVIDNTGQGLQDFFNKFGQSSAFIDAQKARVDSLAGSWDQLKKRVEDFDVALGQAGATSNGFLARLSQMVEMYTKLQQAGKNPIDTLFAAGGPSNLLAGQAINMFNFSQMQQQQAQGQAMAETLKQIAASSGLANTAEEVYNDTLGRIAGTLRLVVSAQQQENTERANAAASTALANAAADKEAKAMSDQATTLGMTNVQIALYKLGIGSLAQAEGQHAADVLKAAAALDAKTAALKSAAQYQAQLAADQTYLTSLQNQLANLGATQEEVILYNAAIAASKAANDDDAQSILSASQALATATKVRQEHEQVLKDEKDALEADQKAMQAQNEFVGQLEDTMAQLDPRFAAQIAYEKEIATLNEGLAQGYITLDQAMELAGKASDKLNKSLADADGAKQLTHLYEQIGDSIVSVLTNSMKDAGAKMREETQNIIKDIAAAWLKAHITTQITQKGDGVGGTGVQGSDLAQAGGFAVGSIGGAAVGGQGQNAQLGASIGALIGSYWGPVGSAIGGFIGGAFGGLFDSSKNPSYQISGSGGYTKGGSQFSDDLGTFGISGQHVNDDMTNQVEQKIEAFDNALASLLPPEMVDSVKARIAAINTSFNGSDPSAVEKAHLDAVIDAVTPQFRKFIDGISGVNNELQAFTSLRGLQADLKATASVIAQLTGTPLERLQDQLQSLATVITNDQATLASALKTQDPTQILAAEQALKQAVVARYQAEIADVQNLLAAEQSLEASSYSLNLSLAQKIGALTGNMGGAVDVAAQRMADLKSQILNATDYGDALNKVQALEQATDDWLSSAQAQIQSNFDAQIQALEDQKSTIQAQAQANSDAAQAAQQAANDARQAQIAALQKQLTLAQAWLNVLDSANQMIQDMQTGSSNPLGGFSQLDILSQIIAEKMRAVQSETGTAQATDAQALLADLQKRLQLIQSGNLYDRSSGAYMQAYNQTLAQIAQVQGIAGPQASQVDKLQAQIDALNAIKSTISGGFSVNSAALDAINAQENALKKQEKDQLDALNKQAADYYTWEQGQAQILEAKRHQEIMDQLNAITGGVDPTQYIAQESTAMAASLNSIDQQITNFLKSISGNTSTSVAGNSGGPAAGGGGGGAGGAGGGPRASSVGVGPSSDTYNIQLTVNGTGMGAQDIADAVDTHLSNNIGPITSAVKRQLKAA
ncbi:MAG: hypothetical protein P4L92_23030 [Rudaea sp.]|nr:hypothetical protein [Rudaea sp.]